MRQNETADTTGIEKKQTPNQYRRVRHGAVNNDVHLFQLAASTDSALERRLFDEVHRGKPSCQFHPPTNIHNKSTVSGKL